MPATLPNRAPANGNAGLAQLQQFIQAVAPSRNVETTSNNITPEGINYLIQQILESNNGLASVSSGQNVAGSYNSSTQSLMVNDLLARAAGEAATRGATTTRTSSNQQSALGQLLNGALAAPGIINAGKTLAGLLGTGSAASGLTASGASLTAAAPSIAGSLSAPFAAIEGIGAGTAAGTSALTVGGTASGASSAAFSGLGAAALPAAAIYAGVTSGLDFGDDVLNGSLRDVINDFGPAGFGVNALYDLFTDPRSVLNNLGENTDDFLSTFLNPIGLGGVANSLGDAVGDIDNVVGGAIKEVGNFFGF